jgi:predicted nuclease of predicted toxin-antitoxin system
MKILFDQGTPAPLRRWLAGHAVATAYEMGWSELENGDLLAAAEQHGFHLLMTTDQNLSYQQNLQSRTIAILILSTTNWPRIKQHVSLVTEAISQMTAGSFHQVSFPV